MTHTLSASELRQFTGTEHWYRHALVRHIRFTDGAKYVADTAGAYWLLDELALAQQFIPQVRAEAFQFWRLTVKPNHSATLICEDGNGLAVYSKEIRFTDFPLDELRLYVTDNTILLPSEY